MFRRRRPLARAAVVGGVAYHAGKKVQEGRDQQAYDAELADQQQPAAPPGGLTDDALVQLEKLGQLKDQGILTEEEFEAQKRKLLMSS